MEGSKVLLFNFVYFFCVFFSTGVDVLATIFVPVFFSTLLRAFRGKLAGVEVLPELNLGKVFLGDTNKPLSFLSLSSVCDSIKDTHGESTFLYDDLSSLDFGLVLPVLSVFFS